MTFAAGFLYDEGRLGQVSCFGFETREEAIAWLNCVSSWDRCSFMLPSCWLKADQGGGTDKQGEEK